MAKNDSKLMLVSPWAMLYHEIAAMFGDDPDIKVEYDEDNVEIKLLVNGVDKADALSQLLPESRTFGNVEVKVSVVPSNEQPTKADLFRRAFCGNPSVVGIRTVDGVMSNPITYVIFKKEVVQYWIDDLGDANGVRSTLRQEMAKELFENANGVFFCTDVE